MNLEEGAYEDSLKAVWDTSSQFISEKLSIWKENKSLARRNTCFNVFLSQGRLLSKPKWRFWGRILLSEVHLQPQMPRIVLCLCSSEVKQRTLRNYISSRLHFAFDHAQSHACDVIPPVSLSNFSPAHLTGAELIQPDMIPVDTLSGCGVLIGLRHMSFGLGIITCTPGGGGGRHIMQLSRWWFRNEYLPRVLSSHSVPKGRKGKRLRNERGEWARDCGDKEKHLSAFPYVFNIGRYWIAQPKSL